MRRTLLHQRLIGLFALALLLFNFPLLALWDRDATVLGVPLFPAALFMLWALLIAALAWLMERAEPRAEGPPGERPE
jgi:uncharacterized membrane protein